ncbi:MAG: alpha-L-arabinofuranosidase C-terminal domain-containing protein [Fimbriimonas sp.]
MSSKSISTLAFASIAAAALAQVTLTVRTDVPGKKVSPTLYGIFFEEINRAGDGGIYAEMVQNRSFEDAAEPIGWSRLSGEISLDRRNPLNEKNPTSLHLKAGPGGASVANDGFLRANADPDLARRLEAYRKQYGEVSTGMHVQAGKTYDLSVFTRGDQKVWATLRGKSGKDLSAQVLISPKATWARSEVKLKATGSDVAARLVLSLRAPGDVWFDTVSLMPADTFKGRKNGLRKDLMEKIAGIKPAFVRFPGGCFVEGFNMANAFRWKKTVGDISQRQGHRNLWGYESTNGLGYHEYLQMCEDLGSVPMFVINCGMAHENSIPLDLMPEFVQDAVDAAEYANGPVTSKWGALRAKNGHPKPFGLRYMEIGNENGGTLYNERYALIYDAMKKAHPEITLIANEWGGLPTSRPIDMIDSHNYNTPSAFLRMATMYDNYDRSRPKVYFGEYAVTQQCGLGNLQAGVAEAAFLTGLERNSDVVLLSSYAPLLSNEPWKAWNPNAIVFDQARVYGTPSYWVQAMFSPNRPDRVFPSEITQKVTTQPLVGAVGLGTYSTQAEFKDLVVTRGDKKLFENDLGSNLDGVRLGEGKWEIVGGALRQTANTNFTAAMVGDVNWTDYTVQVKARKLSGDEGFFVYFATKSPDHRNFWNIAGWGNTQHGIQGADVEGPRLPGRVETGRWYDLRVEVSGPNVRCYLDGVFVQSMTNTPQKSVYSVVGKDDKTGELILKLVNAGESAQPIAVRLESLPAKPLKGRAWVLAGNDPLAENSFNEPMKLSPKESRVAFGGPSFSHTLPAHSVTVMRLK